MRLKMKEQVKIVIGARLTLCTIVRKAQWTFIRADKDLGDARYMGFDYSRDSQALLSANMRVRPNDFFRASTSFVTPLILG
jgi:hypothetical protein